MLGSPLPRVCRFIHDTPRRADKSAQFTAGRVSRLVVMATMPSCEDRFMPENDGYFAAGAEASDELARLRLLEAELDLTWTRSE